MSNTEVLVERLSEYLPKDAKDLGTLNMMMSWRRHRTEAPVSELQIRDFTDHPDQRALVVARLATTGQIVSAETLNLFSSPDIGRTAVLGFVSTHDDYKNQGIFGKVWVEGLGWCEENGLNTIVLWSSDKEHRQIARRFYLAQGAKLADTEHFTIDVPTARQIAKQNNLGL